MVGLYPGIYNNYAHFSTFFIICIVLLLLWLIGRESLARTGMNFHHLLDLRRNKAGGFWCSINLLIKSRDNAGPHWHSSVECGGHYW